MSDPVSIGEFVRTRTTAVGPCRTFIAVEIPDETRRELQRVVAETRGTGSSTRGVRWTRPEGWHLTLMFLGEIGPDEVDVACETSRRVAFQAKPFVARVGGWGAFPSDERPKVLWAGLVTGADELSGLAASLRRELVGAGFAAESRPFHPHLTLARVNDAREGSRLVGALRKRKLDAQAFGVDRLVVFRSELGRGGARYTPLEECPLGGAGSAPPESLRPE